MVVASQIGNIYRFLALLALLSVASTEAFKTSSNAAHRKLAVPTLFTPTRHVSSQECHSTQSCLYSTNNNSLEQNNVLIAQSAEKSFGEKLSASFYSMLPTLLAAFCTAALMYPLDLVRALQMANAGLNLTTKELLMNFYRAHGLKGFFVQGLVPELARSTWMRFIKFGLFPIVHQGLFKKSEKQGNEASKAISAVISSIPEALSIMPLEIAKIALQLDTANEFQNNMFRAMGKVFAEQGIPGMLVGYWGVQYRQSAWSAGYFASIKFFEKKVTAFFNLLKGNNNNQNGNGNVKQVESKGTKMLSTLLSGFLAGVFGACLNTPGDTIRSTLQKRVLSAMKVGGGITSAGTLYTVGQEIVQKGGIGALYAGFTFKAFHLGGGGALMAFLVPFFAQLLNDSKNKKKA